MNIQQLMLTVMCMAIVTTLGCTKRSQFNFEGRDGGLLAEIEIVRDCVNVHYTESNLKDQNNDQLLRASVHACISEFKSFKYLKLRDNDVILDPWGQPLRYRILNRNTRIPVQVWSIGRNGVDENGGGDDIQARPILPNVQ